MQAFFVLCWIMNGLKLNEQLSFSIEQEERGLRLVVSDGSGELVCHKVNRNELKSSFSL